ncbi:MAG: hypothetical protein DRP84_03295 [Spirochaetes bacterium]|nr:MAG: hypothetical protein DRP84_03295 [Spirochaetota bacterium]
MGLSRYKAQSVVITILVVNVLVFLFTYMVHFPIPDFLVRKIVETNNSVLIYAVQRYGLLVTLFSLFPVIIKSMGWFWQFFTYMFLHGSFWHLFFNMYALYLFGKPLEERWGGREFLFFYLFTGIGAGVVTYLWNIFQNPLVPTIGASGALFGVILAFGLEFPETILLLFFFIPIKAKYAALVFGAIEVVMLLTGTMQRIGHFTHIAGILFGYVYYLLRIKGGRYLKGRRRKLAVHSLSRVRTKVNRDIKERKEALKLAHNILIKITSGEKLNLREVDFFKFLKDAYNSSSGICNSEDFEPESELCLKCEGFYACLYRYIIEKLGNMV